MYDWILIISTKHLIVHALWMTFHILLYVLTSSLFAAVDMPLHLNVLRLL